MKHKIVGTLIASIAAFAQVSGYAADAPAQSQEDQAASLDKLIKEFKAARDQAESQAYEAGSRADQYLGQSWIDYRQAIQKQQMYQQQVKDLDAKIAELEKQRAALKK
jgi:hypothetical protein